MGPLPLVSHKEEFSYPAKRSLSELPLGGNIRLGLSDSAVLSPFLLKAVLFGVSHISEARPV